MLTFDLKWVLLSEHFLPHWCILYTLIGVVLRIHVKGLGRYFFHFHRCFCRFGTLFPFDLLCETCHPSVRNLTVASSRLSVVLIAACSHCASLSSSFFVAFWHCPIDLCPLGPRKKLARQLGDFLALANSKLQLPNSSPSPAELATATGIYYATVCRLPRILPLQKQFLLLMSLH